jgi:hypothetical protein
MPLWLAPLVLTGISALAQADPDCADQTWKRQVMDQARLFEIHQAEEDAYARGLSESDRRSRRAAIDDKYGRLRRELEERCRSSVL